MNTAPDITLETLTHYFDPLTYARGEQYYRTNRVETFHLYEEDAHAWFLRSKVFGRQLYTQHIDIDEIQQGNYLIDTDCTCPVGYRCKHAAAALIAYVESADVPPRNPAEKWRDSLIELARKASEGSKTQTSANGQFVIFRLFMDTQSDFEFRKAKWLKSGAISKGHRITCDNMAFALRYQYGDNYISDTMRPFIEKLLATGLEDPNPHSCRLKGEYGAIMLREMVQSGHAYYQEDTVPLRYDSTPLPLTFAWRKTPKGYRLRSTLPSGTHLISATIPPMAIDPDERRLHPLEAPYSAEEINLLLDAPVMPLEVIVEVAQQLQTLPGSPAIPLPDDLASTTIETTPLPTLYLYAEQSEDRMLPMMELRYLYGDHKFAPFPFVAEEHLFSGDTLLKVIRDSAAETAHNATLESMGMHCDPLRRSYLPRTSDLDTTIEVWRRFLDEHLSTLKETGWNIGFDATFDLRFEYAEHLTVETTDPEGVNPWFELSFNITIGGRELPLLPILAPLIARYDSPEALPEKLNIELAPGQYLHLPSAEIAPLFATILELFDADTGGTLVVHPHNAHLVTFDESQTVQWKGLDELKALSEKLRNFEGIEPVDPTPRLQATLRGYQQQGLSWLAFLHAFRFGGILADDMGLGKTLQTLALLDRLQYDGKLTAPVLIIMPTSLMGNWKNEIDKFAPHLTYLPLYGTDRFDKFDEMERYDILLTTYQLAQRDAEHYVGKRFEYIILDEAQKIKNPATKMAQAIKTFTATHRLALSGTPIENHLSELWSIFDFVMPGFLGDLKLFRTFYQNPIEKEHDLTRSDKLNRRIRPFVLRRTKEAVALELPAKTEIVKRAVFDPKQAALYENIRITMEKKVREAVAAKGLSRSHITILDALLKLRQVCCHPQLLKLESAQKVRHSAKLDLFLELIDELMNEGRKVLVFSQFTSMLSILEREIKGRKIPYTKLTGATRKREEAIARFTSGEADIFLISLKAGGVGLNLVAADTVIHYDPWWNPAVENQATDRAYRIGQDKPVFVYKLIVENSIEEKILKLQEKKQALQDGIYGQQNQKEEEVFGGEELLSLLEAES